jgi:hypothetical protein
MQAIGVTANHKKFHDHEKWWNNNGILTREEWRNSEGKFHREGDLPALMCIWYRGIFTIKKKEWYKNGILHREHAPARIEKSVFHTNIEIESTWYKNGKIHRDDDLPAVIIERSTDSTPRELKWFKNGKLHREGDLPAIESSDGDKWWFKRGLQHRDGIIPAVVLNGVDQEVWFKNGKLMSISECIKHETALETIRNFRRRVKLISNAFNTSPKKFAKLIQLIKSRQFIEWWWSPSGIGGRRHKKLMNEWLGKNFKT